MPDPVTVEYLGLPGYLYLWVLAAVAFFVFGRRVLLYARTLREARSENRWDALPRRVWLFVVNVLGQRRLLREPLIGAAHFLIFWSFVFYASSFFWNLVRGLFPVLPFRYADEIPGIAFSLALMGVLGLAALAVAAARRYLFPPAGLERSWDATLILGLIALVLLSSLVGLGARERVPALALGMWWLHMVTVLGFLAYLPYSKHLHLLAAPFSVLFGSLQPGGLPPASEGAARREDFTWRQLFSGLACAECGRCERACPAYNSGYALSPKVLMHEVKELVRAPVDGRNGRRFVGDVVKPDEIWACTTCYACMERCPVLNEHIPLLLEMRRHLVLGGEIDRGLQGVLTNLSRYGNSFGISPRLRSKWTKELGFPVKDAGKEPVEYLWFVGDYASYDPRLVPLTRAAARVFHRAGLEFGILYDGERNSGNDARRVGEEGLFEVLMEGNLKAFAQAGFEQIVTTDPHSYQALKNEYRRNGGGHKVLHYTELLEGLIHTGRLPVRRSLKLSVTYHDPCYLGRYNGIFEAPRRVLEALGARVVEMSRNRADSYCCGAGGGLIWMEDLPAVEERPAENRVREAAALSGVNTLVISCPKDFVMFQDAIKTTRLEDHLVVKDLIELVEQATGSPEE